MNLTTQIQFFHAILYGAFRFKDLMYYFTYHICYCSELYVHRQTDKPASRIAVPQKPIHSAVHSLDKATFDS